VVRKKIGLIFVRLSVIRPCCIKNRNYQYVCLPARKERFCRRDTPGSPQARLSSGKPHPRRIALLARLFSAPLPPLLAPAGLAGPCLYICLSRDWRHRGARGPGVTPGAGQGRVAAPPRAAVVPLDRAALQLIRTTPCS
jgi:hypothetical protein